jgi:hypothetical protein
MDVVAKIAATLGARRRLGQRGFAPPVDQLFGAIIGFAIDHEVNLFEHATSIPGPRML